MSLSSTNCNSGHLFLLETFQMYLVMPLMKKIIKCYPRPILFYHLIDNISVMQQKLQYDTGVAMQDNAAQHWWYNTILAVNIISNTGKLAKTVHPDSFGEEPSSLRLRKLMIAGSSL